MIFQNWKRFENKINFLVLRLITLFNNFQLNVAVAQFYEVYRYFNESISQKYVSKIL